MLRTKPRVLILGGGFAGLACALRLPASRFQVTVVDQKTHFEFLPAIHELLSGRKRPAQLRLPLQPLLNSVRHTYLHARVLQLLPENQCVETDQGSLTYDSLVVALGASDTDFGVAGVNKYSIGFKSVAQCETIGKRLDELSARGTPAAVNVIGAGFEGIEAAGEILARQSGSGLRLTIIDAAPRLLPTATEAVSGHLHSLCQQHNVELLLGSPVKRLTSKTIYLQSGKKIPSDLSIWTGGAAPQTALKHSSLALQSGWLSADTDLRHPNFDNVFAIGDNAETLVNTRRQAYHAMEMGQHCADSIKRQRRGASPQPFTPSNKPQLVSFGSVDTLLLHPSITLSGPALGPLKEGIYQFVMAQFDRRKASRRLTGLIQRGLTAPESLLALWRKNGGYSPLPNCHIKKL